MKNITHIQLKTLSIIFLMLELFALLYYAPYVMAIIGITLVLVFISAAAVAVLLNGDEQKEWARLQTENDAIIQKHAERVADAIGGKLRDSNGFPVIYNRRATDGTDSDGKIRK